MKISISEIENSGNLSKTIDFSQIYEEFNSEIPVKASLCVEITGDFVRIYGKIHAVLNLTCDVCLKEFTKEFDIEADEYYNRGSLCDASCGEFEIKDGGFCEDLNGRDEIDITDFVYQSVILHIPNKLVCDINCKGDENLIKYIKSEITDPRLEVFKNIKIEKEQKNGSTKEKNG